MLHAPGQITDKDYQTQAQANHWCILLLRGFGTCYEYFVTKQLKQPCDMCPGIRDFHPHLKKTVTGVHEEVLNSNFETLFAQVVTKTFG